LGLDNAKSLTAFFQGELDLFGRKDLATARKLPMEFGQQIFNPQRGTDDDNFNPLVAVSTKPGPTSSSGETNKTWTKSASLHAPGQDYPDSAQGLLSNCFSCGSISLL